LVVVTLPSERFGEIPEIGATHSLQDAPDFLSSLPEYRGMMLILAFVMEPLKQVEVVEEAVVNLLGPFY
jgi:hypothetical protein